MLALILSLTFGLSSGFFIANLFNKTARDPMKQLGTNSLALSFMAFFGSQQSFVPFYFEKEPFANFYIWVMASTFFLAFIVTFLVQSKKKKQAV